MGRIGFADHAACQPSRIYGDATLAFRELEIFDPFVVAQSQFSATQ